MKERFELYVDAFGIAESTYRIAVEIAKGRARAQLKHAEKSIEATNPRDYGQWLAILGEEFGEVCESLTYDKDTSNLRTELIDLITVATAWVAGLDRDAARRDSRGYRVCMTCGDEYAYCGGRHEVENERKAK